MPELLVAGHRIHVQRLGVGNSTVVMLHGLVMDNLSSWYFTLGNRLAADHAVVLYDLRGHGRSERPPSGYRIADLVAELRELLERLEVTGPIKLVGNSFGGLLALAFALAEPDRVEKLALVDAHVHVEGWAETMTATLGLEGSERDGMIATSFRHWLGRHSERKRNRLAESAHALVHGTSLLADLRASPAVTESDLAGVRCPVLALYGDGSDALAAGQLLARALPNGTLRLFPGATHSVLWERTHEVRAEVATFFAGE